MYLFLFITHRYVEFPEYDETVPQKALIDSAATWDDVRFLRQHIKLKFLVKGIMTGK